MLWQSHLDYRLGKQKANIIRKTVYRAKWTKDETQRLATYMAKEKNPWVEKIKETKKLKTQKMGEPLIRKQITHLHQAHGHAHPDRIRDMAKKTRMWDKNTIKTITGIV